MNARTRTFSLRGRLTLLLALTVLVVFGTATKLVDWRADSEMQQRFDDSLLARAQSLAALTQVAGGKVAVDADDIPTTVFPGSAGSSWYELRCAGDVVARTSRVPPPLTAGKHPAYADAQLGDGRMLRVVALRFVPVSESGAIKSGTPTCSLRFARDRKPLDDLLDTLDFILLGSLFGACILVVLATPWLVRRGLRPLAVLDQAMAGIGPDAPGVRLPASGTTELAPLVARFNEVLARMDEGLARERQFASGLAHEFRTRLAELRTLVDVEMRYPSGRDTHSMLGEIGNIGTELEATIKALLQLTRIESGFEQSRLEDIPLASLLTREITRHLEAARRRGVRIESEAKCDGAFTIETDPAMLEIVLDNLIGNAVAYAPSGGVISLCATQQGIKVRNQAPSLHAEDLASFGQRFWRKDARGEGHVGLGLALAGAAARALRMTLSFKLEDGVLCASLDWRRDTARA